MNAIINPTDARCMTIFRVRKNNKELSVENPVLSQIYDMYGIFYQIQLLLFFTNLIYRHDSGIYWIYACIHI